MSDTYANQAGPEILVAPTAPPQDASANKKNKANASALQKEINNMEKIRKLLSSTASVEGIPELDEEFKKSLKTANESITAVSSKLNAARKVYAKDIPVHVKKTGASTGLNYKSYSVK